MKINLKKDNKLKLTVIFLVVLAVLVFYFFIFGNKIIIENKDSDLSLNNNFSELNNKIPEDESLPENKITGQRCENGEKRPFAVMLAADKVARPLSGVSQADLVFEMPVITDGITRYMAIFQCEEPKEIGSIRSARHDFITVAQGFDAIYAHWGGSIFALDKLKEGVIDNIDALKNPNNTFYRKSNIKAPHNGFTSFGKMKSTAEKLGFRLKTKFEGYLHIKGKSATKRDYEINIPYPYPYNVKFRYNSSLNSYLRSIGGFKEVDKNTNRQVVVKNLVVMEAMSRQIKDQYNDVDIENSGKVVVYRNGEIIRGKWERKSGKYYFFNNDGNEIEFVFGKIWISVIQPNQSVTIKNI